MENELARSVDALPGSVFTTPPGGRLDLVRSVLEDLPVLSALMDASGRLEFANRQLLEYLGKSLEELKDWGNAGLIHPDDLPGVLEAWSRALQSGKPLDIEYRNRRADGVYRWFQTRGSPIRDAEGRIVLWHIVPLDIDDRKRAELELAGEKRLLEMIASGRPLADVLDALCRFFETAATDCLCGVYPIDWGGPTFQNAVAPSLPASYIAPMEGLPVRLDVAPCGVAAQTRAQVIVEDIESDSRWRESSYRAHVLAHALRSVWSTPISSLDGRVLGTFCIYRHTPATPSPHQQDLIAQVTHVASIAIDRERKEAELKRSEAFLAQAQRLTLTGSLWWKTSTGEITWSEESYRLLEYPVTVTPTAELILRRCHPEDLPLVQEKVGSAIRDGLNMDFEHRLLMPNGAVKHVHVVMQNVGFDSGAPEFVGAVTDITEWKLAQEMLRQSETYLAEAQKLSLTGSVGWSVADDRHVWSDETYRIFGYHPSTRITFPLILQRVHPEDLELVTQALAEAQDGGDFDYEYRLLMPDGAVKYLHLVAHGMRDRNGRLEYIGAVQDVTQRRRSEEALARLRSELAHVSRVTSLGTLAASVAHEVSQPLSGIITNASTCLRMLAGEPPNVDGARETARRTIRDGQRASEVITRLRALFARKNPAIEPVDVNEATREVMALSRSELQRSRTTIRMELAEDLPVVMGDRVQLQQVIMNLLRNASEAMSDVDDRSREVVIRTAHDEDERAVLSVQDAGSGFEPHSAEKLFDAFYTTKQHGMGIGLSVSRSIIESHRGRLWAVPNEGPGVTFSFSIPYRLEEESTEPHGPGAFSTPRVAPDVHAMGTV
jgi:PAS domain S-box-containing protein